jgi:O-antigen/teichoic acid export membrane protein
VNLHRRLRDRIPHGSLLRGVVTLVVGTTLAQGIVIATSPIMTRLYAPSDFGAFLVGASVLGILLTVSVLSYDLAIPLPESDESAANVLALCLAINVVLSAVAFAVLLLIGAPVVAALGAPALSALVALFAVDQVAGGTALGFTGWAIRKRSFTHIARARLSQSGVTVIVQIVMGVAGGLGWLGLFIGDLAGRFTGASLLARGGWRTGAHAFRGVSRHGMAAMARRYRRFPQYSTGSSLLNTLGAQVPLLLLVALYGTTVGGQYALAERVAALPVILVAGSVAQVFVGEGARVVRENPFALRGLYWNATKSLARLGIGPTILVIVTAPFLFRPVFGDAWSDAGIFAAILAPMYLLVLITSPTGGTLDVLERQDLHLVRELMRLLIFSGAILVASVLRIPPVQTVAVLSIAGCLMYTTYGSISLHAIGVHRRRIESEGSPGPSIPPVGPGSPGADPPVAGSAGDAT